MPSFSEILNRLPPRIRTRFGGIQAYAKAIVEADEESLPRRQRTPTQEVQQIQVLTQLVLLDRFFRRATEVARQAVLELEAIGVPGFSVGSTTFEGENEAVRRGASLSEQLRRAVPEVGN